jgi:hypothetical protein
MFIWATGPAKWKITMNGWGDPNLNDTFTVSSDVAAYTWGEWDGIAGGGNLTMIESPDGSQVDITFALGSINVEWTNGGSFLYYDTSYAYNNGNGYGAPSTITLAPDWTVEDW